MSQSTFYPATAYNQIPLRIAINGFGRIGRNVLRVYLAFISHFCSQNPVKQENCDSALPVHIVAINDIGDPQALLHLLKYDSTHGRILPNISLTVSDQYLIITHQHFCQRIALFQQASPADLSWQVLKIDVVLECTGHFRQYSQAYQHIEAGAKQVIIGAAPFDEVDACVVMGVNSDDLTRKAPIISSVSCTTQALVPLLKIINDNFGVQSAMVTEIHAVTADQNVLDQVHRDLRRARAAGHNIIPTTSSSLAAAVRVLPEMQGKIAGYSLRVPTIDVAAIDVTFICDTSNGKAVPTITELNQLLKTMSQTTYHAIMGYTEEPLVSSDFIGQPHSLIIDSLQTMQVGNQIKIFAWYDNEWGYANRLIDMCLWLAHAS